MKKQENYGRRTLMHPIKGEPTFRREFERLQFLALHQFSAPKVVFYGEAMVGRHQRAILVTEALEGYQSLDSLLVTWRQHLSAQQQCVLIAKIATELRRFHRLGLAHRALYPKHIFVKNAHENPEIALIDLEKARFSASILSSALLDLAAFNRHVENVRRSHKLVFFKYYFGLTGQSLNTFYQWVCRRIDKRSQR